MRFDLLPGGDVELVPRPPTSTNPKADPSVFLIEINPRAPRHRETIAIEYTYGIDYWALHMLSALPRDTPGLQTITRALTQPLAEAIQYPTYVAFIPLEKGGKLVQHNMDALPAVPAQFVVEKRVHMELGTVCKTPGMGGGWPFVAYFIAAARTTGPEGRRFVRVVGDRMRGDFEYEME